MDEGARVAVFAGYGFLGEVLESGDAHHRLGGDLALSLRLVEWLGLAVRLDGRYDKHTSVPGGGSDDGWVGDPRLMARAVTKVGDSLGLGGQLTLWAPGSDAPSLVPAATSIDIIGMASYIPAEGALTVSGNLGFRLDQSAESIDNPELLSAADRLSLGVSASNALLLGVGATYRTGSIELLGEWTWDLHVGSNAPDTGDSPMRVSGGLRMMFSESLYGQFMVDLSLSGTPGVDVMDPLAPVLPRFGAMAGLHYRFGGKTEEQILLGGGDDDDDDDDDKPPPPPPPKPAKLAGTLLSDGQPVAGAKLTITVGGETKEITTGEDGSFDVGEIKAGEGSVTVEIDGYDKLSQKISLKEGEEISLDLTLQRTLPPGQLRGFTRSFRGQGVRATLTIMPTGEIITTNDDGSFELDLPPGDYEVTIQAAGFKEQVRQVKIDENGVTILNVDLRK